MLRSFEIHQPHRVEEAAATYGHYGEDAAFYAGGTELLLVMKEGLAHYQHLIDLKTIPGLGTIALDGQWLSIGGTATHRAVERHPAVREAFPITAEVERMVANVRVRNVGTIGGNLCFAEPHSDVGALFLVFEGGVDLAGRSGTRSIPIQEFFRGAYETARQPDEVLPRVRLQRWGPHTRGAYMKFGFHERPTLGVAVAVTLTPDRSGVVDARIAVGSVAPAPTRMPEAEAMLRGRSVSDAEAALEEAAAAAASAVDAVSDLHGSAEYKQEMVKVFVRRAYRAAVQKFQ